MRKLPTDLSGQRVLKALMRAGFVLSRQRGSHMILVRDEPKARVVVPDHHVIRVGILHQILNEAGLTVDQFIELL